MDKMQKKVMVVKNEILFKNYERFQGLSTELGFEKIILENYEFMVRGDAEVHFDYKQPITYAAIIEEGTGKLFFYKRGGASSNAGEARLHDKIAIGIGGHIEPYDEITSDNILKYSLKREVEEELGISENDIIDVKLSGFINDDSNEVNSVHIGVFYTVTVRNSIFSLNDGELANGEFLEIYEIEKMINSGDYDVETWSQIIFEEIKGMTKI